MNRVVLLRVVCVLPAPQCTMSAPLKKIKKVPGSIPTPSSAPGSSTAANAEEKALGKAVSEGYARTLDLIKATSRVLN